LSNLGVGLQLLVNGGGGGFVSGCEFRLSFSSAFGSFDSLSVGFFEFALQIVNALLGSFEFAPVVSRQGSISPLGASPRDLILHALQLGSEVVARVEELFTAALGNVVFVLGGLKSNGQIACLGGSLPLDVSGNVSLGLRAVEHLR